MAAKINHVAIVSDQYALAGKFYEIVFGFKPPKESKLFNAITVGDGYVGMNINPRGPGRPAGLDHFGFEVDDLDATVARMRELYPEVRALKRPRNRAFASYTAHDPDGNIFDLSQIDLENRGEIYASGTWEQDRYFCEYAVRTLNPEKVTNFYIDVLELETRNPEPDDENHYLTDGRMTLAIMPWSIDDYAGTGIIRPGPDHVGFSVENLDAFKEHVDMVTAANPHLAPRPIDVGPEYKARLKLLEQSSHAVYHLGDVDGVLIGVHER
jgi:catechol 2,3-dioxygenase-like lactoylglutathione lyase family enzyme